MSTDSVFSWTPSQEKKPPRILVRFTPALGLERLTPLQGKPQRQQDLVVLFYFQILPFQDGAIEHHTRTQTHVVLEEIALPQNNTSSSFRYTRKEPGLSRLVRI